MSKPVLTTTCDKCGKEDLRSLRDAKAYDHNYVYTSWIPDKWAVHDTEDGDGPEPNKVFVLCDTCEYQFKLSVRDFTPKEAQL